MKAGVLIIGSLLWDNTKDRKSWRRSRLNLSEQMSVRVPIRYGRRSISRGNTFTMVFSNDYNHWGQAILVPCISTIKNVRDLVEEACALWQAEAPSTPKDKVGASWGCVGVLFRDEGFQRNLVHGWKEYFMEHSVKPINPVTAEGKLDIPWPKKLDSSPVSEIDIILATATQAEREHPTVEDIADAWINQDERRERYFFENVKHGIRTPEDLEIWQRIKEKSPKWLNNPDYTQAISLLTKEEAAIQNS